MMTFKSYTLTADWNSEYAVGSPRAPMSFRFQFLWDTGSPHVVWDQGYHAMKTRPCIFALNLTDVGWSRWGFCASIFSRTSLQVTLTLVVTVRWRLGGPGSFALRHGQRLLLNAVLSQIHTAARRSQTRSANYMAPVDLSLRSYVYHKHVLDAGNTVVKR